MKLREINVEKFRSIENLHLSFENLLGNVQPVTVLAGPNGCGKTSVLFAIIQALRGLMGYRAEDVPEPSDFDIHRGKNGDFFAKVAPSVSVKLHIEFAAEELDAIKRVFEDTHGLHPGDKLRPWSGGSVQVAWKYPPALGPDGERRPTWYVKTVDPPEAMLWFKGRLYAIQGWRGGMLKNPNLIDELGGPMLFPQDRSLKSRVTGAGIKTGEDQETTVWEILRDIGQKATSPRVGEGIDNSLQVQARKWEERIQQQFKQICAPKEYLGFVYPPNDPDGAPYFKDGAAYYPLSMASSGEQVILEYITRLTFPRPLNRGLILIDEPEMYLHPGWMRQLYRALTRFGSDNQFIVTTHSAELRAMAAEDGVLIDLGDLQH